MNAMPSVPAATAPMPSALPSASAPTAVLGHPWPATPPRERRAGRQNPDARALDEVVRGARSLQRTSGTTRAVEWLRLHDVQPEVIRRVLDPAAPHRAADDVA
jgi:hypothetical protein